MSIMSTKSEYLQKYIDVKVKRKKLRKKPKVATLKLRIHIIDDDINCATIARDTVPESEEELGDEAPQIVGGVDENSKSLTMNDNKWKKVDNTKESNQPKRLDSDSDLSPPRHEVAADKVFTNEQKPLQQGDSDNDLTPPRSTSKHSNVPKRAFINDDVQPIKNESSRRKRLDSDSDLSPSRHEAVADDVSRNRNNQSQQRDSDSDLTPPRSTSKHISMPKRAVISEKVLPTKSENNPRKRLDSDSDLSPSRDEVAADHVSRSHYKPQQRNLDNSNSSHSNSKHISSKRTSINNAVLSIKNGSKSNYKSAKSEKKSEEKSKRILGKQEKVRTIIQNVGKQLDDDDDNFKGEEKSNSSMNENNEHCVPELFKPLARYKDDPELDEYLKKQERSGDTMLAYIHSKQKKEQNTQNVPMYKGPPPPPNRFNIKPGYRWDGVDRSNGFEKKYFDLQAKKIAKAELAYKWSVENM